MPPGIPFQLTAGPGGILVQQPNKEIFQCIALKMTCKVDDLVIINLVIGQPYRDGIQAVLGCIDGSVYHSLSPVAEIEVFGDFGQRNAGGFDLIDDGLPCITRKDAVGPALDGIADALDFPCL